MNVLVSLLPDLCSTMVFFVVVLSAHGLYVCFDFFYTLTFHLSLICFWKGFNAFWSRAGFGSFPNGIH